MKKKQVAALMLAAIMSSSLVGCGGEETVAADVDLTTISLDEIEQKAQQEGQLETVGMPHDWANWKDSFKALAEMGLSHYDTDLASAEEIALFEAEKDSPTKDLGDIGHTHATIAIERGVVQPYKPLTWESIPNWAKDPEGRWVMSYTGTVAFTVNTDQTDGKVPDSWAELMEGDYVVSPGNVVGGASSQMMVIACALANGGSLDNVQPGIDYFQKLAKEGRLDPGDITQDRLATGEIEVMAGKYDFSGLGYKETIEQNGGHIDVVIPRDGSVRTGYCLIINKYAPHPHAAAMAVEYMLSDAGQIDRARGYARPIREDVELPEDVAAKLLPEEAYSHVLTIQDPELLARAGEEVARLWEEQVLPYMI